LVTHSNDARLTNEVYAELEEQVERTLLTSVVYKWSSRLVNFKFLLLSLLLLAIMSVVLVASMLSFSSALSQSARRFQQDAIGLAEKAKVADSTEEKIDFIFSYVKSELARGQLLPEDFNLGQVARRTLTISNLFILIFTLVLVFTLYYLIARCYPRGVFLWGDYEVYYNQLIERRKSLWNVIIISFIVGMLASLFVLGVSQYLPQLH
jgi:hypothetical protein